MTFVSVNTVSEIIKRRMPVATVPVAAPVLAPTKAPVKTEGSSTKTLATAQKAAGSSTKAPSSQQKTVKNTDSFEKKMTARSKDRRLHYLPIHIVHN